MPEVENFRTRQEFEERPPFKCCISMGSHSVNVFSEVRNFLPYFEEKGVTYISLIPGWKVDYFPSKSGYSIIFIPDSETRFDYVNESNSLTIRGKIEDFRDGQALAYLGFWMMEAQRQRDSMVTCHAAALSTVDNNGVLLLGERGDGKTSVALALGRNYGCKLLANDLAIVGYNKEAQSATIYDGTKIFGLRLSAIRGRFPELLYLFSDQTQRSWTTKAIVHPETIGIEVENNPRPLKKTFMVHLDSTKTDKLSVYRMDDLWVRNYLYENFSRYLRATAIVAFGGKSGDFLDYMPSLDSRELYKNRLQLIRHLIHNIEIWNVSSGSLNEICETICTSMSQ